MIGDSDPMLPTRVHAIVLVSKLHKPTMRALAYAKATRPNVLEAVSVDVDGGRTASSLDEWDEQRHRRPAEGALLAVPRDHPADRRLRARSARPTRATSSPSTSRSTSSATGGSSCCTTRPRCGSRAGCCSPPASWSRPCPTSCVAPSWARSATTGASAAPRPVTSGAAVRGPTGDRDRSRSVGRASTSRSAPVAHGGHFVARAPTGGSSSSGMRCRASVSSSRSPRTAAGSCAPTPSRSSRPSPDRVSPPCPYAGPGGAVAATCSTSTLAAQRGSRRLSSREQLRRLAGLDREVTSRRCRGEPTGSRWRTRMQYVHCDGRRVAQAPFARGRAIDDCLIAAPDAREPGARNGRGARRDRARRARFEVAADGFWQVHPARRGLVESVLDLLAARPGERALDLYAGVGPVRRLPGGRGRAPTGSVIAVEGDRQARGRQDEPRRPAARARCRTVGSTVPPRPVAGVGRPRRPGPARAGAGARSSRRSPPFAPARGLRRLRPGGLRPRSPRLRRRRLPAGDAARLRPVPDDPPRGVCRTAGARGLRGVSTIADFLDLVGQLDEVELSDRSRYTKCEVAGRTFGYLWGPTRTVGLKQTLDEQAALVGERPEVFEVQFTAGGFGWVVAHLEGLERDELAELTFEAWRLSAPPQRLVRSSEPGCDRRSLADSSERASRHSRVRSQRLRRRPALGTRRREASSRTEVQSRWRAARSRRRRPASLGSLASLAASRLQSPSGRARSSRGCPRAAPCVRAPRIVEVTAGPVGDPGQRHLGHRRRRGPRRPAAPPR